MILIVDDEKMITSTLSSLIKIILKENVKVFNDPIEALESEELKQKKVDMIISDFMMPGMNGLEFLKNARETNPEAVAILLTGYADKENAIKSINEVGLYYYLEKPWDNNTLIKVIQNGLEKKELTDVLKRKYDELQESNMKVERLYELLQKDYHQEVENAKNMVVTLSNVIEAKDKYTDGHTRRVSSICKTLGKKLNLPQERLYHLEIAAMIHDVGKVGISDIILGKPDKLTAEEFESIKKHTTIGETICKPLSCMRDCLDPIRHHHEKLNGSGYPDGLRDEEISLEARIITVADIFDALFSDRPYRNKLSIDEVKEIITDEAHNGCLDKNVVATLLEMIDNNELRDLIQN
jgi:putative two-component system response regulator